MLINVAADDPISTFSAFSEMILSELTMARLNYANVLTHFSHSGVDEMADNTW